MASEKYGRAQNLFNYIRRYIPLTGEDEMTILSSLKFRRYLKGQYVLQQGDICRFENYVHSGCLKVFYTDPEGQQHVVMLAVEDWWVADLGSFLSQIPADYNIQCLEDTELIQFSPDALEGLYQKVPQLERFFRIIVQKAFVASQKRIVNNHCLPAKERYLQFSQQYPEINQRVPQYLIASYLGITREFLSRIKSELTSG